MMPPPPSPQRVVTEMAAPGWPRWRTLAAASWLAGAATMAFIINGHERRFAIESLAPGGTRIIGPITFYGPDLLEMLIASAILGLLWALPLALIGRSRHYRYAGAVRLTRVTLGILCISLLLAVATQAIMRNHVLPPASLWDWSSTRAITLTLIAIAANIAWVYRLRWLRPIVVPPRGHLCGRCGYDIRATPYRCPECGTVPMLAPSAAESPAGAQ